MMWRGFRQTLLVAIVFGSMPISERASAQTPAQTQWFEALSTDAKVEIQGNLTAMGHYEGMVDGEFGPMTAAAIMKFQYANGFRETGILSASERALLKSQAA